MVVKKKKSFIKKILAVDDDNPRDEIAPEGKFFVLSDGEVLKTPGDLIEKLKTLPSDQFDHHTKEGRNDFANWLWFVFDEKKLADKIFKAKTQQDTIKILENHYN